MSERDEPGFDPSDWLEKQFADADEPTSPPVPPAPPAAPEQPVVPPAPAPPAAAPPAAPAFPTVPQDPIVPAPPVVPPASTIPPVPPAASGGFTWGLTPGSDPALPPAQPPVAPAEPVIPPAAPTEPAPAIPAFDPTIAFPAPPAAPPPAETTPPLFPPTITLPSEAPAAAAPPAPPVPTDATTALEPAPWEPWQSRPVDPALEGVTEVIEAEIVGVEAPEGESNPTPGLDDLFGDGQFRDYGDEPIITGPPPPGARAPRAAKGERAPIPRVQKVLMWVAGGLVAALALVALFVVGTRLPALLGPAPALTPSPTPTPTPTLIVLPAGPLAPGEYQWDELLGGECLDPFESAWQDRYTVVDCATPHPAQMTARGRFEDAAGTPFPGTEELQKRINLLCTAATVINYQVAATAIDIQVSASFPVDEADWDAGNRTYFCFVNRASGENLSASVAVPQPAVTLTPAPVAP